jgi:hypothetical protein
MINDWAMINWNTTSPLLNVMPFTAFADSLLFNAVMGLKPERTIEG